MAGLVAVIAALPREVKQLVAGAKAEAAPGTGITLHRFGSAVVVTGGMGASRVSLAFEEALRAGEVVEVISMGLAGACAPCFGAGTVVEPTRVVDVRTGERFGAQGRDEGAVLASADAIASVGEKARLHAAYGAGLVDMEAATVARLAQAHGIPFRAVKGISDPYDFELASLSRFADSKGQFRTVAFALHTALHPAEWKPAMALGRNSALALQAMTARVQELLASTT